MRRVLQQFRRFRRSERAQAGFEFLMVLPAFFLVFLVLVDFGVTMYKYVSISNAAREGARYGAVNCGDGSCTAAEIKTRAVDRSGGTLSNVADVTVGWPAGGNRGESVVVKVSHTHTLLFFPIDWTIETCADMRLEQKDNGVTAASGTACS